MKEEIRDKLDSFLPGLKISNLGYLPRWIVLLIDIGILVFAAIISYFLLLNLNIKFQYSVPASIRYLVVVGVNTFYFFVFKTYSGIIRHSTFIDGIKLLLATFFGFFTLLVFNYVNYFAKGTMLFLTPGLVFNFVLNFSLLFLFRILVKSMFERFFSVRATERLIPALVYGTDANAIAVANALKLEIPSRFKLVGFISNKSQSSSKTLLDLPMLQSNRRISVLMRSMGVQALILADNLMSTEDKRQLVDDCLDNGIKVYSLPIITDWENQKEISRKIQTIKIEDLLERKPIVLDKSNLALQIHQKRILVTGAAGSIGSEIARQVMAFEPEELILVDQAETPLHHLCLEIEKLNPDIKIQVVIQDIRNREAMERVFQKFLPNKVYHAAAYKHVPLMEQNPDQAILVNVMGTKNIADLALKYKADKFVLVSTDKAVNPSNVMGASKRIAEKYVQSLFYSQEELQSNSVTKFVTTRFGNVLGSNGSVVPLFAKQIEAGGPVTITHPDIIRYFMTIPEACQLVLEAGVMGNGGEIYLFDMGKPVRIIDLAKKMIRMAGYIPTTDIEIKVTGLRPGEKLFEELLNNASKTLPTRHEKIVVAQEPLENYQEIPIMIDELVQLAKEDSHVAIVTYMKKIVPEFISNNSEYQLLDK